MGLNVVVSAGVIKTGSYSLCLQEYTFFLVFTTSEVIDVRSFISHETFFNLG